MISLPVKGLQLQVLTLLRDFFSFPPFKNRGRNVISMSKPLSCHGLWKKPQGFSPTRSVSYGHTRQARRTVCSGEHGTPSAQVSSQSKTGSSTRQVQNRHSEIVLESLTGTQAALGRHSTLLFVMTNTPSSFCLLLHTLKTTGVVVLPHYVVQEWTVHVF